MEEDASQTNFESVRMLHFRDPARYNILITTQVARLYNSPVKHNCKTVQLISETDWSIYPFQFLQNRIHRKRQMPCVVVRTRKGNKVEVRNPDAKHKRFSEHVGTRWWYVSSHTLFHTNMFPPGRGIVLRTIDHLFSVSDLSAFANFSSRGTLQFHSARCHGQAYVLHRGLL
jgi:hypothetical protein